ncbi:sigma-70 family RNA polymerase sigma factor, partial [Mammaliicoccus lentus]
LWDLLKSYDESKSTNQEKYIYLKLKYYLIDCLRKNIKEITRFLPTSDYTLLDQSYSDFYQYELYSLLEILNEEELTWLNLTLQGFSTNEIIIYMNKSPSSIKRYRKSTREKLKSEFLF